MRSNIIAFKTSDYETDDDALLIYEGSLLMRNSSREIPFSLSSKTRNLVSKVDLTGTLASV
jgi:hypothetical protein